MPVLLGYLVVSNGNWLYDYDMNIFIQQIFIECFLHVRCGSSGRDAVNLDKDSVFMEIIF